MTQDLIVTLVALGAVAFFAVRSFLRRRKPAATACASCASHEGNGGRQKATPASDSGAKPVTFYGSRR